MPHIKKEMGIKMITEMVIMWQKVFIFFILFFVRTGLDWRMGRILSGC